MLMLKSRSLFVCCLLIIVSACSTYTTNTDIEFESTRIYDKPSVFIAEDGEEIESSKLDYLGWITAEVRKPTWFDDKPTKLQANIVLAEIAKERGGQAVFFVTYDWSALGTLTAKGQAARVDGVDHIGRFKEHLKQKQEEEKAAKLALYKLENSDNIAVIFDTEGDPLAEAYMQAHPIEKQIEQSGPELVSIPRAAVLSMIEEMQALQTEAFEAKNIKQYAAITELLHQLKLYQDAN